MRVIAGQWRGRRLVAPAGSATRPTADRARESLFSMLSSRLGDFTGLAVADFYAGSGALGIEALSRGAARCHFVDSDRKSAEAIAANLASLAAQDRSAVSICPAESFAGARPFDLIFADPPYAPGAGQRFVELVAERGWLAAGGWLAIETARGDAVAAAPFLLEADRDIGRARITLLRRP